MTVARWRTWLLVGLAMLIVPAGWIALTAGETIRSWNGALDSIALDVERSHVGLEAPAMGEQQHGDPVQHAVAASERCAELARNTTLTEPLDPLCSALRTFLAATRDAGTQGAGDRYHQALDEVRRAIDVAAPQIHVRADRRRDAFVGALLAVSALVSVITLRLEATQRRLERDRRRSEAERAALLQNLAEGVLGLDADGTVVGANDAAARLLDRDIDEILEVPFTELLRCPQTGGPLPVDMDAAMQPDAGVHLPDLCVRPDPDEKHLEVTLTPTHADDETPFGAVVVLRDITPERRYRRALERTARATRSVIDHAGDAYMAIDREGRVVGWNRTAARTFGWAADEAIGRSLGELLVPERLRADHESGFRRYLADGEVHVLGERLELPALHRNGHEVPVELVIWESVDEDDPAAFHAFLRDVSDRVAAERALRARERQLSEAELVADMGSWTWDIHTNDMSSSEGLRQLTGAEGVAGSTFEQNVELVHPDDRDRVRTTVLETLEAKDRDAFTLEHRVAREEGIRILRTAGRVERDDSGAPVRVLGVSRDVTEERRAERLRAELTAVATHELKTPLTSIQGALSLLESPAFVDELSDQAKRMVDLASRNAQRLLDLANDLLDVERLATGDLPLRPEPTDVAGLLSEARGCMDGLARERDVSLEVAPVPEGLAALVDPGRMMQVLTNLVSNAIKFSDPGGTVVIRARTAESTLELLVSDTGRGIPAAQLARVFDRFYQVDPSDPRERSGSGLGLAIVREIIERHGGTIEAHSDGLGHGATMRIQLPDRVMPSEGDTPSAASGTSTAATVHPV